MMKRIRPGQISPGTHHIRALAAILAIGVFAVPVALAQSQSGAPPQPSFEAATVKPTPNPAPGQGYWNYPGQSRFSAHDLSLQFLIQMAWGIEANQLAGKPSWLDSDFYDVEAKPEEGIKLSPDELKPRLQNLLVERFHLAAHFETKMVHGYALVVAKGGPKLQPTKGDHFPGWRIDTSAGHLDGLNWSMPYLAKMLQHATDLPVGDETGITGSYDIKLEFAPELEQDSTLPSLFTALRETLGLELKAQQIPMQVLVIDHIDRVPVAN
jgi:uncharacterized protein (TIGR03435 family)